MAPAIGRLLAIAGCLSATGCVSIQAIEPVQSPPPQFRFDTSTRIEFVSGMTIGIRCAERGAKFLGLPAINSGACADSQLITMLDPCLTITGGNYARDLCASRSVRSEPAKEARVSSSLSAMPVAYRQFATPSGSASRTATLDGPLSVTFISRQDLYERCGSLPDRLTAPVLSCRLGDILLVSNPCEPTFGGWYERTLCHELAHVNGWRADHSGGEPRHQILRASESPEARAYAMREAQIGAPSSR